MTGLAGSSVIVVSCGALLKLCGPDFSADSRVVHGASGDGVVRVDSARVVEHRGAVSNTRCTLLVDPREQSGGR
jgi:hypothetical protein